MIGCPVLPAGQEVRHGAEHQERSGQTDSCSAAAAAHWFTGNSPPAAAAVHHLCCYCLLTVSVPQMAPLSMALGDALSPLQTVSEVTSCKDANTLFWSECRAPLV